MSSEEANDLLSQVISITSVYPIERLIFYFSCEDSYGKYYTLFSSIYRTVKCEYLRSLPESIQLNFDLQQDISGYFSIIKSSVIEAKLNSIDDVIIHRYCSGSTSLINFDFSLPSDYINMRYSESCDVGYNTEIIYCNINILTELSKFENNIADYHVLTESGNKILWNNFYHRSFLKRLSIKSLLGLKRLLEGSQSEQSLSAKVLRRIQNNLDYLYVSGETSLAASTCVDRIYPIMDLKCFMKYHIHNQKLRRYLRLYKDNDFCNLLHHTLIDKQSILTIYPFALRKGLLSVNDELDDYLGYVVFSNNISEEFSFLIKDFILYMFLNKIHCFTNESVGDDIYFTFLCSRYEIEEVDCFTIVCNESSYTYGLRGASFD